MTIHRLLGLAWIPNNDNKQIINHKDGNKLNLDLSNLEWSTYSENNKHAFDNNLKQPSKVKSEDCNLTLHTVDEVIKVCEYLQAGYTPKAIHNIFNFDYDFAQKFIKEKHGRIFHVNMILAELFYIISISHLKKLIK